MSTLLLVCVSVFVCTGDLENGCLMMMMMLCKTKYFREEEEGETDESEDEGARTRRGD